MSPEYVRKADLETSVQELMVRFRHPLKLFGLCSSSEYAKQVAGHLGVELIPHTETTFDDGECYVKSADGNIGNVRGHNVFVIGSLYTDEKESVNDKFMKMAIFCGSLRQASAHSITAVIPHWAYARQDQKDKSRAPVATKICAKMLEAVGVGRFLFMDVHNLAAAQNAFSITTNMDNLECKNLHAAWCAKELRGQHRKLAVFSPDTGGLKRANKFRATLAHLLGVSEYEIELAVHDKIRDPHTGEITGGRIIGDVKDRLVIALDDMISTGGTIVRGCEAVARHGGEVFAICATHGLFAGNANENLERVHCRIVVADTVSPFRLNEKNRMKLRIVNTSKMMADAVRRIHSGTGSISGLLENLDLLQEQG